MSDIRPGVVVRVRDWPGTQGDRYVVQRLVERDKGPYRQQVYAHVIENWPSRDYPNGQTGAFHAFPLDRCSVDDKAQRRWSA